MVSAHLVELAGFFLGLLLGSFLNVCISRLPHGRSVVSPRSHCPGCAAPIRPLDNIPLLSWILLAARCRQCRQPISWRYPMVELSYGLWLAAVLYFAHLQYIAERAFWNDLPGTLLNTVGLAVLGFLLIGLVVIDWQTHRLPDAFTIRGAIFGLVLVCLQAAFLGPGEQSIHFTPKHSLRLRSPGSFAATGDTVLTGPEHLILGRLLAVLAAAGLLLLIRWVYFQARGRHLPPPTAGDADHRFGLGLGDVKMLAMIAAFLGLESAVLTLFLATLLATAYALPLVILRRANRLTKLPFGSFLGLAGLAAAFFSDPVLTWYESLFR